MKMAQISEQMVDEKGQHVEETKSDYLIGADAGCLMNIGRSNGAPKNACTSNAHSGSIKQSIKFIEWGGTDMPMKIGTDDFKKRVDSGINNTFMRGVVPVPKIDSK